jgi:hypothetical protein
MSYVENILESIKGLISTASTVTTAVTTTTAATATTTPPPPGCAGLLTLAPREGRTGPQQKNQGCQDRFFCQIHTLSS